MCIICNTKNIKDIVNRTYINCSDCSLLQSIPKELVNLTYLDCSSCPLLQSIPKKLVNLTSLDCYDCPLLQSIPNELVNLTSLDCYGCPLLQSIPNELVNLTSLNCSYCRLILWIPKMVNCFYIKFYYCPWLNHIRNTNHPNNIEKLLLIQKWFKGCLISKKLKRMYKPILEIYLHPDYKGGYLHKRDMMSFLAEGI
jgi:hypothetical protein